MRSKTWGGLMAAGCAALTALPLAAQQSMLLRFDPEAGRGVRTISWTDIAMTIGDLPSEAGRAWADTLRVDVHVLQSVSERVLERRGDRFVLRRAVDSTRSRVRVMGGSWREVAAGTDAPPTARLLVTERYQIEEFEARPGDSAAAAAEWLRNPAGAFELAFPVEPVGVGGSWSTELVFPLPSGLDVAETGAEVIAGAELVAQVTATLDSIVPRGTDTLAYLRVEGRFLPTTVSEAAEVARGTASIRGAFAAQLIWSTGWDAWVSGATRAQLTVRVVAAAEEEAATGFALRMDSTSRFQVRP